MTTTKPSRIHKQKSSHSALWLGDLHLEKADKRHHANLYKTIRRSDSELVIITGDVSNAGSLVDHLKNLASACWPRACYYVPGNHDYHGSSVANLEMTLIKLHEEVANFYYLDGKEIIPLGDETCLIGHGGWADARAGMGLDTHIDNPDRRAIHDFHGMGRKEALRKMQDLGRQSASLIRRILPLALTRYKHVVIATHVPPFPTAVRYEKQPCGRLHLPHFSNLSVGLAIIGIAKAFPARKITVLAGHAHSECTQTILPNLTIKVGHARTGRPAAFDLLNV